MAPAFIFLFSLGAFDSSNLAIADEPVAHDAGPFPPLTFFFCWGRKDSYGHGLEGRDEHLLCSAAWSARRHNTAGPSDKTIGAQAVSVRLRLCRQP